jgi:two-component system, LuxR family, sensor kinase FixL
MPDSTKSSNERLETLVRLADMAQTTDNLQALLDLGVNEVSRLLAVPFVRFVEYIGASDACFPRARCGPWEDEANTLYPARPRASLCGLALSVREPVIVEDLPSETRFSDSVLEAHEIVACAAVPLNSTDIPPAVLAVYDTASRTFSPDDLLFLQVAAYILGSAAGQRHFDDALRESEAKARAILETTVDGVITIDEYGRIISFNTAAERIFGYVADEVVGQNVRLLMPEPYQEEHDGYIRSYRETGRRQIIGIGREVTGKRKDGSTFPMDLAVSEVSLAGRRLFTGIVRDISVRRQLEQEILRITDLERRRIGQDLHDGLGQMLTGIGLISRNLARRMEALGLEQAEEVAEIATMVRESDELARNLARGLVPVELDENGLPNALQRLADSSTRMLGIHCTVEQSGQVNLNDSNVGNHIYRIAQEAISNSVRHGEAKNVQVSLVNSEEHLRLRVVDDGTGIPAVLPEERGMGLRIMHYRARIIGASLEIRPSSTGGTVVICTRRHDRGSTTNGSTIIQSASADHVQNSHR